MEEGGITPSFSCRCAAGFFAQILNDEPEALIQRQFLDYFLPAKRVIDKGGGHEVRQHLRIAEMGKISVHLFRKLAAGVFQFGIKFDDFCAQGIGLDGWGRFGFERFDPGNRKRRALGEPGEANALQTLEDEIRSSITAPHAGANQSDAGDVKEIFGRIPLSTLRLEQGNGKHPVLLQSMLEHFLVAWLEDVEGQ